MSQITQTGTTILPDGTILYHEEMYGIKNTYTPPPKQVRTTEEKERIAYNRKFAEEGFARERKFKETVSEEDKMLEEMFHWTQFEHDTPVKLEDVVFGEKYMYMQGDGLPTGVVRSLSSETQWGIRVEFITTGRQHILFETDTEKKLYKLPAHPRTAINSYDTTYKINNVIQHIKQIFNNI
jgi:hypothetical protein